MSLAFYHMEELYFLSHLFLHFLRQMQRLLFYSLVVIRYLFCCFSDPTQIWPVGTPSSWHLCSSDMSPPFFLKHFLTFHIVLFLIQPRISRLFREP